MNKYAIIVAGGSGARMQAEAPKQFMLLNKKPVILYSIEAFYNYSSEIKLILVLHPDYIRIWDKICVDLRVNIPHHVVLGGSTRFQSVKNGLSAIDSEGLVAIHDAARPLINTSFVEKLFVEAEKFGSSIPGIAVNDTIRQFDGEASFQLDRSTLRAMQTPQVFKISELQTAYRQTYTELFTDDASVMQAAGMPLHFSDGLPANIKITFLQDITIAEALKSLKP
jgi:2-C-methyl-D-erythritol 4-phosphate cytidylyltransferase